MLVAKSPIIYLGKEYKKGETLPGDSPLASKWVENGVAERKGEKPAPVVKEEPKEEPKAKEVKEESVKPIGRKGK